MRAESSHDILKHKVIIYKLGSFKLGMQMLV